MKNNGYFKNERGGATFDQEVEKRRRKRRRKY